MEAGDVRPSGPYSWDRTLLPVRAGKKAGRSHRRFGRTLTVLAGAAVVALGCVALLLGISWVRSEAAVSVVRTQLEAIRNGEVEQAYALFSHEYQAETTLPMFRRWLRRERRLANIQQIEFWGRSVWGRTALLWGNFRDDLGHSYPVRYLLIHENGTWRVDRFSLAAEIPDPMPPETRFLHI
ncbi:MAG: DUF4864 domain-containing protein [Acidobacteria bacterium]|nr:DUF4864 domain-containing protein [Acidobacteriota bacterium]